MKTSRLPKKLSRVARLAIMGSLALGFARVAEATPVDIRVAWNFNGIDDPGSYAPNPPAADFNELLLGFSNATQTGGHSAANLDDAITFTPTGIGVTWAGWRRENSNIPAAFSSDVAWVDRAGSGSQLAGNDGGAPTVSSVTFTGLVSGNAYNVEVVMTGISGVFWSVLINSSNANTTHSGGQLGSLAAWNPQTNGSNQNDWLIWNGVNAPVSGDGSLTINFSNAGSGGLDGVSAIRITGAIPEPSTVGLLALGLPALFTLRRRPTRRGRGAE